MTKLYIAALVLSLGFMLWVVETYGSRDCKQRVRESGCVGEECERMLCLQCGLGCGEDY